MGGVVSLQEEIKKKGLRKGQAEDEATGTVTDYFFLGTSTYFTFH
jgi:hypothetical protein